MVGGRGREAHCSRAVIGRASNQHEQFLLGYILDKKVKPEMTA